MGGNALKKCFTRRYSKKEYEDICERVLEILKKYGVTAYIPRTFPGKESFGDLDVVYTPKDDKPQSLLDPKVIAKEFNSCEYVVNGNVVSYEFEEFQVDLIKSTETIFENHCYYLDYNDLGGILGQITYQYRIKYGHKGLILTVHYKNDPTLPMGPIILTHEPREFYKFMGMDFSVLERGFQTEEEFFHFLTTCRFFKKEFFRDVNYNHGHRTRAKKRPLYGRFLDYLGDLGDERAEVDVIAVQEETLRYFGKFEEYERIKERYEIKQAVKSKFNGEIVGRVTGRERQALGDFMKAFKDTYSNDWIYEHTAEEVLEAVRSFRL